MLRLMVLALAAARAWVDHARAFASLARARPAMPLAGGSHAQRDVFERLTVDAAIRSGHLDGAEGILAERRALIARARRAPSAAAE